jgi:hypothetical protein
VSQPADDDEEQATSEAEVEVAPALVVADSQTTTAAEVLPDSIRIPFAVGVRYAALSRGTIFVGARGGNNGKNPDGFLRRVESARVDGGVVILMTGPATLTDAILNGSIKASSAGGSIDGNGNGNELRAGKDVGTIDVDFGNQVAFHNIDEIATAAGTTKFTETIKLETAHLFARPSVDIDLHIQGGKVNRFTAKVEGHLDTSIAARVEVSAEGVVSPETNTALREKKHQVSRVIYKSKRIPLPTFSVGKVPLSTAVEFTVTLKCDLAFGGPLVARAGVDAKSYVRLAAVQKGGEWAPPVKSDFDIRPSFSIERGSEADAHCALQADAELSAYGTSGITMTVAPYVDFGISRAAPQLSGANDGTYRIGSLLYTAQAGATGSMRGKPDVFGLTAAVDRPLADWKSTQLLSGEVPPSP